MANFRRSGFDSRGSNSRGRRESSGFRDSKPKRFSRDGPDRGERRPRLELFEATCDKCKKQCEVPFRPSGEKPVYCSDCFKKNDSRNDSFEPRGESRSSSSSPDLTEINRKLDKILELLESSN